MKYNRWLIIFFALIAMVCNRNGEQKTTAGEDAKMTPIAVVVETVRERTFAERLPFNGEVTPMRQVEVLPRVSGKVIAKWGQLGQRVEKDQLLAEILQDMPGMEYTPVKIEAVAAGVITQDLIEIGATVTPQRPVYVISELRQVYIATQVYESFIDQVKTGEAVEVWIAGLERPLIGRVAEISPVAQRLSRTIEVKVLVENPADRLRPGMSAICYFTTNARQAIAVPLDAIIRLGAEKYVYRLEQDRARLLNIRTGSIQDQFVAVISGLSAGDRVVVAGHNQLQDGAPIRIIQER